MHLNGDITISLYAINPETQRSKWVAIDADFDGASGVPVSIAMGTEAGRSGRRIGTIAPRRASLDLRRRATAGLRMPDLCLQSRPPARIPVKGGGLKEGIEVFPRQDRIEDGELGNAIRAPLGVHRKTNRRYWFYEAEPTPEAQLAYLDRLTKLTEAELRTFIKGMSLPEAYRPVVAGLVHSAHFISQLPGVPDSRLRADDAQGQPELVGKVSFLRWRRSRPLGDNLAIQIKDPRFYKCWAGCTKEEIRAALGQSIRKRAAV